MFRPKKSPQEAAIEKEAKASYKFIEKHREDQFEIDLFLNSIADKELGREILQKVQDMAAVHLTSLKPDNKKHEAAIQLHQLAKDRAFAAVLRKAAYESMVLTINGNTR